MKRSLISQKHRRASAFTLVELLISMTVLAILMLVCTSALDQTQRSWLLARSKVDQFREARIAFETVSRNLAQAELSNYWDYFYAGNGSSEGATSLPEAPSAYVRQSELQFQSGPATRLIGTPASPSRYPGHALFFQAPLGLSRDHPGLGTLLNARGYYVEFDSDETDKPPFIVERGLPLSYRYRLMEYRPPAERSVAGKIPYQGNAIYQKPEDWFRQDISTASRVVAENILLLIASPRVPDAVASAAKRDPWWVAPRYNYNSLDRDNSTVDVEDVRLRSDGSVDQGTQHLLPPLVDLTMVAVDEASAKLWTEKRANQPVSLLLEAEAPFASAARREEDLEKLKVYLTREKLNYRIFTATIAMRQARWDGRAF